MGPLDFDDSCGTCSLPYRLCPGHFGHIELPFPVYHPLLFTHLYSILKTICTNCHHFRMNPLLKNLYVQKLRLLNEHRLVEAAALDDVIQGEGKKGEGKGTDAKKPGRSSSATASSVSPPTAMEYHLVSERRQTIRAFLKNMPTRSCDCCQAAAVSYKKNRDSKIFRKVAAGKKKGGGDDGNMQYVTPMEVLAHFQYLWQNEEEIVSIIWSSALSPSAVMKETQNEGYRIFFLFVLPIPPNKFRPANKVCSKCCPTIHLFFKFLCFLIR
jgi:DNA-directed RNA polymerase I subunit RPA1